MKKKTKPTKLDLLVSIFFISLYFYFFNFSVYFLALLLCYLLAYFNNVEFRTVIAIMTFIFSISHFLNPTHQVDWQNIKEEQIPLFLAEEQKHKNYKFDINPSGIFFKKKIPLPCHKQEAILRYVTMTTYGESKKKLAVSIDCSHKENGSKIDLTNFHHSSFDKYKMGVWIHLINCLVCLFLIHFKRRNLQCLY